MPNHSMISLAFASFSWKVLRNCITRRSAPLSSSCIATAASNDQIHRRCLMTTATAVPLTDISRRVVRLQIITLVWMSVEAAVSLGTAWHAHSPAMLGFGGDSLIELLSAAVVFCNLLFHFDETRAARMVGALLFALAGLVVLTSVLNFIGYREARRSLIGISILMTAAIAMPWLANQKRKLAVVTSSA